jgi:hypothetical protein
MLIPASRADESVASPVSAFSEEIFVMDQDKIVIHADPDLADLIPGFLLNRQKDLRTLREVLQRHDFETIRSVAHILTGLGGSYGFDRITELGEAIGRAARQGDVTVIGELVDALAGYLERVEVVYE